MHPESPSAGPGGQPAPALGPAAAGCVRSPRLRCALRLSGLGLDLLVLGVFPLRILTPSPLLAVGKV